MEPIGLIGRKVGMTRLFTDEGESIPVTVVEVTPNRVAQLKTIDNDGYNALQLVAGTVKQNKVSKPQAGHFKKAGVEAGNVIREYRTNDLSQYELNQEITVQQVFETVKNVDVTGISKGKGFQGTVKRHNFRTQDATHGNSLSHRAPGSIGQNQTPGRVFKGKKMAGQMGNKRCTVQSLQLVKIDAERNLMLIKGSVPGAPGAMVEVKPAVKKHEGTN